MKNPRTFKNSPPKEKTVKQKPVHSFVLKDKTLSAEEGKKMIEDISENRNVIHITFENNSMP